MTHIYCCRCGVETECEAEDLQMGRVFKCPACGLIEARVRGPGGSGWVTVQPEQAEFLRLLEPQT